jgi:hypothetical protein
MRPFRGCGTPPRAVPRHRGGHDAVLLRPYVHGGRAPAGLRGPQGRRHRHRCYQHLRSDQRDLGRRAAQDGVRPVVSDRHRAGRWTPAHHGRPGFGQQGGDDAGDLGERAVGEAAGRGHVQRPVLPTQLRGPQDPDAHLHGRGADHSRWFDVDATTGGLRGRWTAGPTHIWKFNRDYGTAAMYEAGKILYTGGAATPPGSNLRMRRPARPPISPRRST